MTDNHLIEAGRTAGAYGVRGWVRVVLHAREGDLLTLTENWWFLPYPRRAGVAPKALTVMEMKEHGKDFIVRFVEVKTREEAMVLKGSLLVDRSSLPELEEGDFYDDDILDFEVVNEKDESLGRVVGITDNGAQDLLIVQPAGGQSFYIPMVEAYVLEIDFEARCVRVDWFADWN